MAKPTENQTKAIAGLTKALEGQPGASYASLSGWKKSIEAGVMITVGSLVSHGFVEEITIVGPGDKPAKAYRPKV